MDTFKIKRMDKTIYREYMNKVLIIGSGHNAKEYENYKNFNFIVIVVNNAWKITEDWDYWVSAGNYKGETPLTIKNNQIVVTQFDYNKSLLKHGGIHNCGFSIMLNTSYWVLENLNPSEIYYLGADMDYTPNEMGDTHFYGIGNDIRTYRKSDPDIMVELNSKGDINYLENIYMRFYNIAKNKNIKVFNLSSNINSRLPYPRINLK